MNIGFSIWFSISANLTVIGNSASNMYYFLNI